MQNRIDILNVPIDSFSEEEVLERVDLFLSSSCSDTLFIVTANPEILVHSHVDASYRESLKDADMILPDGIGVMIAASLLGSPLQQKLPGYDLMHKFLQYAGATGKSVFFYGAQPGRAQQASQNAQNLYKGLQVSGTLDGYTGNRTQDARILAEQNPNFVFVALGAPAQELWIKQNRHLFSNSVLVGVGGSLDILSGAINRAPDFWIRHNLEWFYRLVTQPTRFKRFLKIPLFFYYILQNKVKRKKA